MVVMANLLVIAMKLRLGERASHPFLACDPNEIAGERKA
jgi:hypothetical protein